MTLKERLDNKVKMESLNALFHEIEEIFLNQDLERLKRGVTVKIFSSTGKELFYIVNEESYTGRRFKNQYTIEELYTILPKIRNNGIEAERTRDGANLHYQR